jgi:hypothetical protein
MNGKGAQKGLGGRRFFFGGFDANGKMDAETSSA